MRHFKFLLLGAAAILFLAGASGVWDAMALQEQGTGPDKVEAPRKTQDFKKAPGVTVSVKKMTHFVKRIEGGILYTQGGQFSLTGVNVIDLTGDPKVVKPEKKPPKTAEMTFVNGQLKEVVIRQRK